MTLFEENKRFWEMLEEAHGIILAQKEAMEILQQKLDRKNVQLKEVNKKGA